MWTVYGSQTMSVHGDSVAQAGWVRVDRCTVFCEMPTIEIDGKCPSPYGTLRTDQVIHQLKVRFTHFSQLTNCSQSTKKPIMVAINMNIDTIALINLKSLRSLCRIADFLSISPAHSARDIGKPRIVRIPSPNQYKGNSNDLIDCIRRCFKVPINLNNTESTIRLY